MRFLFSLFLISTLFSDPEAPSIVATIEGEPSCFVGDTVGAIMGDAVIAQDDIVVQGAEPIRVRRVYSSYNTDNEYSGWELFPHLYMFVTVDKKKGKVKTASVSMPSGGGLYFTNPQKIGDGREKMTVDIGDHAIGFTNNASGVISGQTNLKNHSIIYKKKKIFHHDSDYKHVNIHLYTPDGGERIYKKYRNRDYDSYISLSFRLEWEKLSNGNKIVYKYQKDGRISQIYTTNTAENKTYAWIKFHYDKSNDRLHYGRSFHIETCDGRRVDYHFHYNEKAEKHYLGHVNGTTPYHDSIAYHGVVKIKKTSRLPRVHRRLIHNAPILGIQYYLPGKVNGLDIHDLHYDHLGKVANIEAPAGPNGEETPLYRFYYHCGKVRGGDHGLKRDGHTDVLDADGNLCVFHYTKHLRPSSIVQHHLENTLQILDRATRFVWGPEDFRNIGNLQVKFLTYPDGSLASSRTFQYDERGNPIQEELYDNLSKQKYTKRYQLSNDGFNLILRQDEDNGKITYFAYYPYTNRLSMRLIGDKTRIYKREFFEYNADHILIKEINDDGSSFNPNDLSNISIRKIKIITPKQYNPGQNLPEIIEEKYWNGSQEILLNKTILHYNAYAWVVRKDIYDATSTFKYSIHFKYDLFGRMTEETDPIGRTTCYAYDIQGNQIQIDDPGKRFLTHITYNPMHHPTLIEIKTQDGKSRLTRHRYDKKGNKISTIDLFGNETSYSYDAYGHLLSTTYPDRSTEVRTYDIFGNASSITDPNGHATFTQYNAYNKPTLITYPDKTTEQNIYNPDGTLKTFIDPLNTETHYTYDLLGRVLTKEITASGNRLSLETYTYNGFEMTSFTDASGITTIFRYDGAGRKIEEVKGDRRTTYTYDSLGRLHQTTSHDTVHIHEYDLLNRVIEERIENTQHQLLKLTSYTYDTAGNQTEMTTGSITHRFAYDDLGRKIASVDPEGNITSITYLEDRFLQKITTDPLNVSSIETYDFRNRLILLEKRSPSNTLLSQEAFSYDPAGNLVQQISTILPQNKTILTTRAYDSMNRLTQIVEAAGTHEQKTTSFTYLIKSLKDKIYKPNGTVIEHAYDPLGRLSTISSDDSSYAYAYDPLHRPIAITDLRNNLISHRSYNIYGEITEETFPHNYTLQTTYDPLGRKTSLILPDHSIISYTYDSIYLKAVSYKDYIYTYDSYDLSGHLTEAHLIKDLGPLHFTYDASGRLLSLSTPFTLETIDSRDPCGHITQVTASGTTQFSYDHLYQLSSETSPRFQQTYTHDSHNNRLIENQEINALNQPSTQTYDLNGNLADASDLHFTYDGFDRLTQLVKDETIAYRYTYDGWHRRLSQTTYLWHQGNWIEYQTLYFLYDGDNEIGALDTSGNFSQLRILGQGIGAEISAAIALELHGQLFAPLHDYRGNITALVSPSIQQIVEQYQYTAFGEETILSSPVSRYDNPWRFASKRTDSYTRLIFFGRRYYDPASGRWITPDPRGHTETPNLYAFVLNDPITRFDHYGLVPDYFPDTPARFHGPLGGFQQLSCDLGLAFSTVSHHLVPIPGIRNALISAGNLLQGQVGWHKDPHSFIGHEGDIPLSTATGNPNLSFIAYGNGMCNSPNEVSARVQEISKKFNGGRIDYVYNSSHGFVSDGLEALGGLVGISSHPERLAKKMFKEKLAQNPEGKAVLMSHSQGGLIFHNATINLPTSMKQQIYHFTMGSAKIIPNEGFSGVTNYISTYDPVPMINPFQYLQALISNQGHVQFMKGNGVPDHSYHGVTYQTAEQYVIDYISTPTGAK